MQWDIYLPSKIGWNRFASDTESLYMGWKESAPMEVEDTIKCDDCGSRNLHTDETRGETTCGDCGLVLEDKAIDLGPDWRSFEGDDKSRTGAPMNIMMHDKGLSTELDWQNRDFSGKALSSKSRIQFHRLRKWQARARTTKNMDRNLTIAFAEIQRMGGNMGLPKSVQEEASVYYRKALENNLIRGRSIDSMAAACLYLANQKIGSARSLDDMVKGTRVGRKPLTRAYKVLKQTLRLRIAPIQPEVYINRYCAELGLRPVIEAKVKDLIEQCRQRDMVDGRSPTGVAAAAVYIISRIEGQPRTQREIADMSGVTEVTIRNRYKEFCAALGIELEQA